MAKKVLIYLCALASAFGKKVGLGWFKSKATDKEPVSPSKSKKPHLPKKKKYYPRPWGMSRKRWLHERVHVKPPKRCKGLKKAACAEEAPTGSVKLHRTWSDIIGSRILVRVFHALL